MLRVRNMMENMKIKGINRKIIAGLLTAAVVILPGCSSGIGSQTYNAVHPTSGTVNANIDVTGILVPASQAQLSNQKSGVVTNIAVQEGDLVDEGQLLIAIDKRNYQIQTDIARTKVSQAEATVEQTRTALDTAETDLARQKELLSAGAVSQKQYDTAYNAYVTAKTAYDMAVKASLPAARESLQDASLSLEKADVVSPIKGIVADIAVNKGEDLQADSKVATVVDISKLLLSVNVSAEKISWLKEGLSVNVTSDSLSGETFPGTITFISPISVSSGNLFPVKITIDNPGMVLKAGMAGQASLKISKQADLSVPSSAVFNESGKDYVFVVDNNGSVKKTEIAAGLRGKDNIEILSGIDKNSIIISSDVEKILDGDKLKYKLQ